jgi:GAF domain-containing protein
MRISGKFMIMVSKEKIAGENLSRMVPAIRSLLEDESDLIAALANVSALIKCCLDDINWAGFYFLKGRELVLGPFQGLPACSRIGEGKGVCGRAVREGRPLVVPDVHQFPGHIACDSASASEMVVPLFRGETIFGVLDVDSPVPNRFAKLEADQLILAGAAVNAFLERILPPDPA